jgi:hypothetical protein
MSGRWRHKKRAKLAADAARLVVSNPMLEAFQVWVSKDVSPFSKNGGYTSEFAELFDTGRYGDTIALDHAVPKLPVLGFDRVPRNNPRKEDPMSYTHHHGSGRWGTRPRRALGYGHDSDPNPQGSGRWGKEPSDGFMPMSVMPANNETNVSGTGSTSSTRQSSPNRQNNRGSAIVDFLTKLDFPPDKIEQVLQVLNDDPAMDSEEDTPQGWTEDPIDTPKDRRSGPGVANARKKSGGAATLSSSVASCRVAA